MKPRTKDTILAIVAPALVAGVLLLQGCGTTSEQWHQFLTSQELQDGLMGLSAAQKGGSYNYRTGETYYPPARTFNNLNCTTRYVGNNAYTNCW